MATKQGSLDQVIVPFLASHFDNLYTQAGGFLRFNGKEWTVTPIAVKSKEKTTEYELIIKELCINGLPATLNRDNQELFLTKVNDYFTDVKYFLTTPNQESGEIRFNSKAKGYEFLSHFHVTLMLNPEGQVFPSSEAFYHIHLMRFMKTPSLPSKLEDPLIIKKLGDNAKEAWIKADPEKHTEEKYHAAAEKIMQYALRSKFNLNTKLKMLLLETKETPLVEENTTSLYFASTKGFDGQEMGKNRVGEILDGLRKDLKKVPLKF